MSRLCLGLVGVWVMTGLGEFYETLGQLEGWLASVFLLMSRLYLVFVGFGGGIPLIACRCACLLDVDLENLRTYLIFC